MKQSQVFNVITPPKPSVESQASQFLAFASLEPAVDFQKSVSNLFFSIIKGNWFTNYKQISCSQKLFCLHFLTRSQKVTFF